MNFCTHCSGTEDQTRCDTKTYRLFATRMSQLKICDFPEENFKDFELL